jgi:ankyrin repeat protein
LATVNGNLKIIRTLIEAGANVNAQDADGKTPIVKAIECNHEELVQFFLFAGADTGLADYENGNTPLHWALSSGSVKAAQYLLRNAKQLDVNKRNNVRIALFVNLFCDVNYEIVLSQIKSVLIRY